MTNTDGAAANAGEVEVSRGGAPDRETAARESTGERDATVARLRSLSNLLDSSIRVPGTNVTVGLDPVVGALPVVGDVATAPFSAYIVLEAIALGVPRETVARMALNLALDSTLGSVPVVGDLFDAGWKANARNVALLESRLDDPDGGRTDRWFLAGTFALLVACILGLSAATLLALSWLAGTVL